VNHQRLHLLLLKLLLLCSSRCCCQETGAIHACAKGWWHLGTEAQVGAAGAVWEAA
jgi:hypothetical protein